MIEVDGRHHYSHDAYTDRERPAPQLYAEMVAEDRRIRLAGYEVFRFGAYELMQPNSADVARRFFAKLLSMGT